MKRLGSALDLAPGAIERAIDASRHVFTAREKPVPHGSLDALRSFIEIMKHDRRQTLSRGYVLNLANKLYHGAMRQ